MAGLIGYVSKDRPVSAAEMVRCLEKLSFLGYDSAGIGGINENGSLWRSRARTMRDLVRQANGTHRNCQAIIGHQRWATHGVPSEKNTHPHFDRAKTIAVVQSGIVENYRELKEALIAPFNFTSETDTEVLAVFLGDVYHRMRQDGVKGDPSLLQLALVEAMNKVEGEFALAAVTSNEPGVLVATRRGKPLYVTSEQTGTYMVATTIDPAPFPQMEQAGALNINDGAVIALCP